MAIRVHLSALFLLVATATFGAPGSASDPMVLPFIQNDYDRAVAEAKARGVPLFIEAWAPW